MKGKFFLEIVNNQIVGSGQVEDSAGPGFWAIRFSPPTEGLPALTRVVPAERMQAMAFFDSPQDMEAFAGNVLGPVDEVPEDEPQIEHEEEEHPTSD